MAVLHLMGKVAVISVPSGLVILASMVVSPSPVMVTKPFLSTMATDSSKERQVMIPVASSGCTVTVS